ncbi:uncharacterized protein BCR38DRAFT_338963 [Pseudomassariella vexata]|uniref:C2H2-type domain-containing protein n=1 Tax=Pseudomassariella vexata TaxID=1141098 RepID=A0A1Y2E304_9PEZI|nr:uncharacterized protein BCR38DRAFT_338963 [Pseudomassariella vexata]ORY65930.1 hypothetical protein BCR38DRAFT_338963 [Pseudomassariella vexata]
MASEQGPVAAPQSSTISQASIPSVESLQADATRATASLKRARETTPTSPTSAIAAQFDLSPSKAARLIGAASRHSPAPLTGAAALEDLRREEQQYREQASATTENPAYKARAELMSAGALAMSRPQDAPMGADPAILGPPIVSIPTSTGGDAEGKANVSPQSATSMASLGSGPPPVTSSPGPMDIDRAGYGPQPPAQMEEKGNGTSLSFPGTILPPNAASTMPAPPARGMSLPMTPNQTTPRSPNSKKHKCPYCETEFTRHHNLKSHLLTHSQEKPYVCQTCNMRFRRLHDLKRHSKLHTGEKPHVCPKCDRKFARGDALARHSKGPGGCVSRRGSLGFGEEDVEGASQLEGDDSSMSGVVYDGMNEADMTDEDRRRLSLPSIKAQHVQGNQAAPEGFAQHSRSYPPPGATGRLYPPNSERGSVSSNAPNASSSMYSQSAMTESPKPLSPSGLQGHDGSIARQRSPSLTTQFQQQHFGRHQTDRQTPPGLSPTSSYPEALPPIVASSGGGHSRTSSGLGQNGGSGDSTSNNIFATDQGIWAYIHSLEESIRDLGGRVQILEQTERSQEDKITVLAAEAAHLREQLEAKTNPAEATPTKAADLDQLQ